MKLVRLSIVVTGVLVLSGCATAPISFMTSTPEAADATFACALRKISALNYTVTNVNKEAGFITAEKQTSGLGTQLMTGQKYGTALTISVFDALDGKRSLRVTAGQSTEKAVLFGAASKTTGKPSSAGIADAKLILTSCGQGEIIQQSSLQYFSGVIAETL